MSDLNGSMTDEKFHILATTSISNWWNAQPSLVAKFGLVSPEEVYTTWSCKAIENFKGLFGVPREGDGLYFEFTFHAKMSRCYLDVYKKQDKITISV